MIRLQELLLSLAAAGIVAALVMSGRTGSGDRGWDPRESQAALFHSQDALPFRPSYLSTGPTLTRWAGSTVAPQVRPAVLGPGQVKGVLISLVQEPSLASVVPPPVCTYASIQAVGQQNQACSTAATTYDPGSGCSVNAAPSSSPLSCSTTTGQGYCSSNVGTPGGSGGPSNCSVQGAATGGGKNSCSAGTGAIPNNCSTQANSNNAGATTSTCSAGLGTGASSGNFCSSGNPSGGTPAAGTCSTTAGSIPDKTTQTNSCSVSNGGVEGNSNQCSTSATGISTSCSTYASDGAGTTTDSCSVSSTQTHAVCTTLTGTPSGGKGFCSAQNGATGNCSVNNGGGNFTGPVNNLCGSP